MGAIGERARTGQPVSEPYGTARQYLSLDEQTISTLTTIGKNAHRPLELATPIMITGMAYGAALRERAKVCLAHASSLIDTATNSGESGFLPEERQAAKKHIVQWNRGRWGNDLTDMAKADAIEIQVGQGAEGSLGTPVKADDIRPDSRAHLGLKPGEDATRPSHFRDITHPMRFEDLVDTLRNTSGGVPIGLKFAAAMSLAKTPAGR
jgi:glutamate synthase domain-containing protein 2